MNSQSRALRSAIGIVLAGILWTASLAAQPFIPANQMTIQVNPAVAFDPRTSTFKYHYGVRNLPSSKQAAWDLIVEFMTTKAPPFNPTRPSGWSGGKNTTQIREQGDEAFVPENIISWNAALESDDIFPGRSRDGFAFFSKALPGVVRSWTKGDTPLPGPENIGRDDVRIPNPYSPDDAVIVKTVGPDMSPDGVSPLQLLERLIGLKHQTVQLGWIGRLKPEERDDRDKKHRDDDKRHERGRERDDREDEERGKGVIQSLDVKLEAAKLHLLRGKFKTAGNILHAFIHELEAQRGKHVNENAFFLLKPNAEFILAQLPHKEKKDKDDDDRHRHEDRNHPKKSR